MPSSSDHSSSEDDDTGEDNFPVMAAASILAASKGADVVGAAGAIRKPAPAILNLSDASTVTHENRWQIMYDRLVVYKKKKGNCLVPNRFPEDTQLGSWVSAQRRQYKIVTSGGQESAAMTPERAMKLRELGFEWSTSNPRNVPWETRFDELRSFVANYGHAEVPMRWEENPQLSNWVSKQRHQYKLMQMARPSRLTRARVSMLNDIGFVWEASRRRLDGESGSESDNSDEELELELEATKKKRKKKKRQKSDNNPSDALPVFSEGRKGRMGMDPPAAMGGAAVGQDPYAAAQALMAAGQAHFGMWAAAQDGRAPPFMPPQMNPAAAAAAAGQGVNPAMFFNPMSPWGAMMPGGMPGAMPFTPAQMQKMQASMMQQQQTEMASRQEAPLGRNNDPPTDSEGGGEDSENESAAPIAALQPQDQE